MLAIKTILAHKDTVGTLIFDEIDTGVSGRASQKIGLKLRAVAEDTQVICVTHSAQIASLAGAHFLIQKQVKGERTYTQVQRLDFDGRARELARIMGGLEITPALPVYGRGNATYCPGGIITMGVNMEQKVKNRGTCAFQPVTE